MNFLDILLLFVVLISALFMFFYHLKTSHPIKNIVLNILISWVAWGVINNITFLTGIYIPLNLYSLITCSVYGLPGISGMIALSVIFGL